MIISYYNGFFDGVPAFLGYAFGVFFTFRIRINALPASDPGISYFLTSSVFPPKRNTACFAS